MAQICTGKRHSGRLPKRWHETKTGHTAQYLIDYHHHHHRHHHQFNYDDDDGVDYGDDDPIP
jgi:hypothetical protein